MFPILVKLGPFELRSYSLMVAIAFLAGAYLAGREAKRRGINPELVNQFIFYVLLAGLIGARLYYVAFYDLGGFLRRPFEVLAIWKGGLALHGGLIAGLLTGVWFCRKNRIPFWQFADTLAPAIILGQAIGRLACFLNGDAYGRPTNLPWGVTFTDPNSMAPLGVPLHPTQLYELGLDLVLFFILWSMRTRTTYSGQVFLTYASGYALIRLFVENFRGDQLLIAGAISAAQALSGIILIGALSALYFLRKRV